MWISRNERRILAGICQFIDNIDDEKWYETSELGKLLSGGPPFGDLVPGEPRFEKIHEYGETVTSTTNFDQLKEAIQAMLKQRARASATLSMLEDRKLIRLTKHESEDVVGIALTTRGFDLGDRYQRWFARSGLWFEAYRNHWIWLLVGFIGGIMGTLFTNWWTAS